MTATMPADNDSTTEVPPASAFPKAYVVFDLEITDPDGYEAYRLAGQRSVKRYGGRVLSGEPAPRGIVETLEGDWDTRRLVIVEFPTVQVARDWYASEEYKKAIAHRQATSIGRVLLVEGWKKSW